MRTNSSPKNILYIGQDRVVISIHCSKSSLGILKFKLFTEFSYFFLENEKYHG